MLRTAMYFLTCVLTLGSTLAAAEKKEICTDPAKAGPDFAIQGEYSGEMKTANGTAKSGCQVIALGGGKFHAVGYPGGLPGDGWDGKVKHEIDGQRTGDTIVGVGTNPSAGLVGEISMTQAVFSSDKGSAVIEGGKMIVKNAEGKVVAELNRVERKSPTLGAKAPAGAIVLFDGTTADNFRGGRMTEDHLLMQGATSKRTFQDCTLHVEFRTPYMPEDRGQGRGNSGCYLQGRYEVQILDSFGLEGKDNECGGIYTVHQPEVNMCFPPLAWQTYDIDYKAAVYKDGKKVQDATITVRHNGVLIQKDVKLPHATTAAPNREGATPGPVYLQDHGNPVRFRNVWVVEKK
ncbi:MAG: 3-keto-disaccharide hydrolase [Pirellulales bacterium]